VLIAIKQLRMERSLVPGTQLSVRELKKSEDKYHFPKRRRGEVALVIAVAMHRKSI